MVVPVVGGLPVQDGGQDVFIVYHKPPVIEFKSLFDPG